MADKNYCVAKCKCGKSCKVNKDNPEDKDVCCHFRMYEKNLDRIIFVFANN